MPAFRQFAVSAVAATALSLGLAGCTVERPAEVPSSASLVTEGNERLTYEAPYDGTVYIYDLPSNRIVYTGKIAKGQSVVVDPVNNRVTLGGMTVTEKAINAGTRRRIFFDRESRTEGVTVERTTTTEHHD